MKLLKKIPFNLSFLRPIRKRWFTTINYIPKRIRVVSAVIIVTSVLLLITFLQFTEHWILFGVIFGLISYFMAYIALFENIDGVEWYMLFIVPVVLSISLYLFFSLFPVRWLTRLPFLVIFGMSYYAVLLISNIFNVGVDKSLQLYRAAFSINFLLQTFIIFIVITVILSFKQVFILNGVGIFIMSFLLSLQLFWSVSPSTELSRKSFRFALLTALLLSEWVLYLSFVPLKPNVFALVVTAGYYSISGIVYHHIDERLFNNVVREYSFVFIFVCFIAMLTLQW